MNSHKTVLSVQMTQIDYDVTRAGALDNTPLARSPVIRVFGKASTGVNCCLHIHQVYPYFYVEYLGDMDPESLHQYIVRLTHALNHAIAISLKRDPTAQKAQYIRSIVLVKGVHFYGFHHAYSAFLKVYVVDPTLVSRAATILQSGTVMATPFRVFENHINYILQFLCDFGLYGCGWIDLSDVLQCGTHETAPSMPFRASPYFSRTRMAMEFDVIAPYILNHHRLTARNMHHRLKIPADPLPSEPFVPSTRELWDDERRRRAAASLPGLPPTPADPTRNSRGVGGEWVAEARWWDEIRQRISAEGESLAVQAEEPAWSRWIMTTSESIEALWPNEFKTWRLEPRDARDKGELSNPYEVVANASQRLEGYGRDKSSGQDIDIDTTMLSSQDLSTLIEEEEAANDHALLPLDIVDEEDDAADPTVDDNSSPQPENPTNLRLSPYPSADSAGLQTPHKEDSTMSQGNFTLNKTEEISRFADAFRKVAGPGFHGSPSVVDGYRFPARSQAHHIDSSREESQNIQDVLSSARINKSARPFLDETLDASILESFSTGEDDGARTRRPKKKMRFNEDSFVIEPPLFTNANNTGETYTRRIFNTQPPRASLALAKQRPINAYVYAQPPPSSGEVAATMAGYNIPAKIYRDPYYSKSEDASDLPWEFAGLRYDIKGGDGLTNLELWAGAALPPSDDGGLFGFFDNRGVGGWEYAASPPSLREVETWKASERAQTATPSVISSRSQIDALTPRTFGFGFTPNPQTAANLRAKQPMAILSLEVFAQTRESFVANPEQDEICVVFWSFQSDASSEPSHYRRGVFTVMDSLSASSKLYGSSLISVSDELELLNSVIDLVVDLDPDILVGWEIQSSSWGYLAARAQTYGFEIGEQISRVLGQSRTTGKNDQWAVRKTSTFRVIGRHVLNLWRIMRSELTLQSYTFENAAFHLLKRRVPKYMPASLTAWYKSGDPAHVTQFVRALSARTAMVLEMLDAAEIVTKTAEFARVFGVDFFSVLSRGSQYKVESFMFRIAKPESFVLLTPSKRDVGNQNAAECMPLIMEPLSAFYNSPLVVLDFQSLYPSVMIAYNYCYSTCLGRPSRFKGQYKLGVTEFSLEEGLLRLLQDHITVAPNGIMYVREDVRKGLLGRMLTELLDTRVMVKQSMKTWKNDKALQRVLKARQLGLKFIANVTYGYTSASFSGRMPLVEVADSIVQTGREILEKAIQFIDETERFGARVVYGDTDSLFVYLPGKTKEQAFRVGHEIADSITKQHPAPIKLKFEKVYLPCVLLAKKRYVGFMYETPDDQEPVFDAKGIETVRRDGVPAQQRMVETALKTLFRSQDLSAVKEYCQSSWRKILQGSVSVQDFVFAREVRLGTYSDKVPPPPGVAVAAVRMALDPYNEPQYGERIPYVILRGDAGSRLVDRAVAPEDMLNSKSSQLDGVYYISRVLIPPLARIFNLLGADVNRWFLELPRNARVEDAIEVDNGTLSRLDWEDIQATADARQLQVSSRCVFCGDLKADRGLCDSCWTHPQEILAELLSRRRAAEERVKAAHIVCVSCAEVSPAVGQIECVSLDCSWFFERHKAGRLWEEASSAEQRVEDLVSTDTADSGDVSRSS